MNTLVKTNGSVNPSTFNSFFDEFFKGELPSVFNTNLSSSVSVPKANISEDADKFEVQLAVPGIEKDKIQIDLDKKTLTISAEAKNEEKVKENNLLRSEFNYTSFKRSFKLPNTIDEAKIEAAYENGILNVTLPKREEAKEQPARKIEIS